MQRRIDNDDFWRAFRRRVKGKNPDAYITAHGYNITAQESNGGISQTIIEKDFDVPFVAATAGRATSERVKALIETACQLFSEGAPQVDADKIHRLYKADTSSGLEAVRTVSALDA